VGIHGQLALDELAAVDVLLEEPVEAVQFDAVSVEVDVVDLPADAFAAAVVELPEVPEVVAVVAVVPDAMQAPSTAVARRLAAPAATRERAAGRLRRDRFGMGFG
jgi:ribosomal protein L10